MSIFSRFLAPNSRHRSHSLPISGGNFGNTGHIKSPSVSIPNNLKLSECWQNISLIKHESQVEQWINKVIVPGKKELTQDEIFLLVCLYLRTAHTDIKDEKDRKNNSFKENGGEFCYLQFLDWCQSRKIINALNSVEHIKKNVSGILLFAEGKSIHFEISHLLKNEIVDIDYNQLANGFNSNNNVAEASSSNKSLLKIIEDGEEKTETKSDLFECYCAKHTEFNTYGIARGDRLMPFHEALRVNENFSKSLEKKKKSNSSDSPTLSAAMALTVKSIHDFKVEKVSGSDLTREAHYFQKKSEFLKSLGLPETTSIFIQIERKNMLNPVIFASLEELEVTENEQ